MGCEERKVVDLEGGLRVGLGILVVKCLERREDEVLVYE